MYYHRHILNSRVTSLGVPDTIAGLEAWHRFDVTDYLTLDGSNNVSYSQDLSGNGNDLEQYTGSTDPVYNASGYIQGGSLRSLTGKNFFFLSTYEVFYVLNRNNVLSSQVQSLSITVGTSSSDRFHIGVHPTVYRPQLAVATPAFSYTAAVPLTAAAAAFGLHNWSHDSGTSYVNLNNGTEQSSATPDPTANGSRNFTYLNVSQLATQYKELIVYNRRLSASERSQIKTYLNGKYSLY